MTIRPIIFSGPMVRALLEGRIRIESTNEIICLANSEIIEAIRELEKKSG